MRKTLLAFMAVCAIMVGCSASPTPNPVLALPEVTVGIVGATQPMGTVELLAGYIPEGRELASGKALLDFDTNLMSLVRTQGGATRTFRFIPADDAVKLPVASDKHLTALQHWIEVGRANNVELLIIPQILTWHELEGSSAGAVSSAEVGLSFFLVDAKNGALLQRSYFAEKQQNLSSNLLSAGTFFKRGAKWLTAQELADEAVVKMIKEFGL